MKVYILVSLTIIGWIIVFFINKHFHNKTNSRSLMHKIYEEIDNIVQLANDFWVNERIDSSHGDYLMLTQSFKKCRQLISHLKSSEEAIRLLNKSKIMLTTTPRSMSSYSDIKKNSVSSLKKYELGIDYLDQVRKLITPFTP